MEDAIRVELPLRAPSRILDSCHTMSQLREKYPKLKFVKYIYLDPLDNKLKGTNPPDDTPVVKDAYITVMGELDEVIKFTEDATKQ